jgi:hypothetical protein
LYIDQVNDRIILEVYDSQHDEKMVWWTYQLSTGKKLETHSPNQLNDEGAQIGQWLAKEKESEKIKEEPAEDLSEHMKKEEFKIKLEHVETRELNPESTGKVSKEGEIYNFVIDHQGRFAYINSTLNGELEFVLVSQSGETVKRFSLQNINHETQYFRLSHLAEDQFILSVSGYSKQPSMAWIIDANKETINHIENFQCPAIEVIAGYAAGFYVLSNLQEVNTTIEELRRVVEIDVGVEENDKT